jgi:hypothetical protein
MPPFVSTTAYSDDTSLSLSSHSVLSVESKPKHSVTFSDCTSGNYVERVPESAHKEVWFSRDEYKFIKERNVLVVELIRLNRFEESTEFTAQGMETTVADRIDLYDSLDAVLEEQYRQNASGKRSRRRISRASQRESRVHREIALLRGLQYEREVWGVKESTTSTTSSQELAADDDVNDDIIDFTEIGEEDPTVIRPVSSKTRQKGLTMSPMKTMKKLLTSTRKRKPRNGVKLAPVEEQWDDWTRFFPPSPPLSLE